MADKKPATNDAAALREARTGSVLDMATAESKSVHANRASGSVSATASLSVEDNDGSKTVTDGASATVKLETSHSETPNAK